MAQVKDGYHLIASRTGKEQICFVLTLEGDQRVHFNGALYAIDKLIEQGYTFTPLVAMTEERINALKAFVDGQLWEMGDEAFDVNCRVLRSMLKELEATDAT